MGALDQWGADAARIERLQPGFGNDVWTVRVNGSLAVARLGKRSDADLSWETELLRHLDREGMTVPVPIPTADGRDFAEGLVVMTYAEGEPPETKADWRRVADTLRRLHQLTQGWRQRPGRRSSTDLVLPHNAAGLDDDTRDVATQASAVWEAAVCWDPTGADEFAARRLAEVRAV